LNKIDLHIHSHYSDDGDLTINEILNACLKCGVKTISITDHNSVKGVKEAIHSSEQFGVEVIPGIEIDCTFDSVDLHLLGYFINYNLTAFAELEQNLYQQEKDAFPQKVANLRKIGIIVDEEKVIKKADNKIICGELIGEVILDDEHNKNNELLKPYFKGGNCSDMPYLNFYWDFFAQGKIAYVPLKYLSLIDAINLVKSSNGIPVIAHPGENLKDNLDMIDLVIQQGIMGLEVFSNYHNQNQIEYFQKKAIENKLIMTCGSDFHGKNKPGIQIGSCKCNLDETQIIDALKATYSL
jgi:predicted metal-dependent phosphoesterase TrpH